MMRRRSGLVLAALVILVLITSVPGHSYSLQGNPWPDGSVVMQLQLGSSSGTLIDGASSWGIAAEDALAIWNQNLNRVHFTVVRDSTAATGGNNRLNNVFFSSTVYGKPFDDYGTSTQTNGIIAVTLYWYFQGSNRTEADVVFNNNVSWNSYRGALRRASNGGVLHDFHRVALHEFGHVLGLNHPNDNGQNVVAQMNSVESNLDTLASDDIAGVQAIYVGSSSPPPSSGTPVVVTFPPRNESLDFRNQLEGKYRDGLHRGPTATYVDLEGSVVWMQEYLRYRVNRCSHTDAVSKVFMQIDGLGVQAVCGIATSLAFPPRNEPLDFGGQLEAKYRDSLHRTTTGTYVDLEGNAVWTQEYLRLRVGGCSHPGAVQSVFAQIDGTTPQCR